MNLSKACNNHQLHLSCDLCPVCICYLWHGSLPQRAACSMLKKLQCCCVHAAKTILYSACVCSRLGRISCNIIDWSYEIYVIHCLSVDTSATQGLLTCFACRGNLSSSQAGSETMKKLTWESRSSSSLRRSLSCSANASFCTSCNINSAEASTVNHSTCNHTADWPKLKLTCKKLHLQSSV